jgi:hypothetical protein
LSYQYRAWSVIYCDEWDHDRGEPAGGGQCLTECGTEAQAILAAAWWSRAIASGMLSEYEPGGEVIVTDPDHRYVKALGTSPATMARAS